MSLFPLSTAAGQFRVFLPNSWSVPFQKFLPFLAPQRRRQRAPNESGQVPPLARKKGQEKSSVSLPPPPSSASPFSSFRPHSLLLSPFLPRSLPAALLPRPFQVLRIHQVSHSHVFPWTIRYFVRCVEEYFFESLGESSARLLRPSSLLPLRSLRPSPQFEKGREEGGFAALGRLPLPPLFTPFLSNPSPRTQGQPPSSDPETERGEGFTPFHRRGD